jgi:spore coat polysaccharide biosynthesis protein SpsF
MAGTGGILMVGDLLPSVAEEPLDTQPHPLIVGVIAARSDSSRLPGKALRMVADRPLVGYVIERAKRIGGLAALALATTDRPVDDELAAFARACGVGVCRGATDDVAGRLHACAAGFGADYLVRLNGDSPFLDPASLEEGLAQAAEGYDVITSVPGRTFPYGVSVEIVRCAALRDALPKMTAEDREHVMPYFYRNATSYRIRELSSPRPELAEARMVVDTEEDLRVFEQVVATLGDAALTASYVDVAPLYLAAGHTR